MRLILVHVKSLLLTLFVLSTVFSGGAGSSFMVMGGGEGPAWYDWILVALAASLSSVLGWTGDRFSDFWFWLKDAALVLWLEFSAWLTENLPPEFMDILRDATEHDAWGFIADISWILPVIPVLSIVSLAYTTCAVIRLVRWLLKLVPFVNLG